ncbi:hypothetical protein NE683_08815 [Bariatricus massiliensis]|uniref:CRISPR type III-associated protein domain-containing protein n=1 Tax=Bariatricus massiliensis TaxID=1745713 RepID=A0ABS8DHM2_9FIRM|nr:RAMP superfamily CRISPR-associated protein [Bariatricus massiliensis]MCB7304919.1 hypothetical protein [Bariatricus massiliensis]MCB7375473.1 hypothetical protein [Bariatricus massiliensis]MCB7387933.1 hypothetical protein [Bariatricus massiliensis]MCB7412247.1 hypothetical protein [Bariatricus massiliensis]MCQ5253332.1 hypothetical protein [Bariatricus massiliensis]
MKRWDLKIVLKSDLCTATGENVPGITNVKTALEYGIPYVPAKRIKGCLVEAGREMADNGIIEADVLKQLFGAPGLECEKGVYIQDAHLYSAPKHLFGLNEEGSFIIKDYEQFRKAAESCLEIDESFLEEVFTGRRARTAVDAELGSAQAHSLRTVQTVPAGIVLTAWLEGELSDEGERALELCAKGFRHMGLGITRGFGEVRCSLEKVFSGNQDCAVPVKQDKRELLEKFSPEEEVELAYEIRLDSPVIVETDSEAQMDCLPGTAVLGALAGMYIRKYSLGANSHEDESFRRIFLRDGVQFGYGFLKRGDKQYVPCPKALAVKKDSQSEWFNIWCENPRRKEIGGQIFLEDSKLHVAVPQKEIHFHHARPADRGIAHALNDRAEDTTHQTGQFFEYIALSKGQVFAGTWKGMTKDIKKLTECLADNAWRLRLGRSRTAEYGECTFCIKGINPSGQGKGSAVTGKEWLVWLLSPMIPEDDKNSGPFIEWSSIKEQAEKIIGYSVKGFQSACSYTVVNGYNSKWRMPSVSYPALAAGSAFYITLDTDKEIRISELEGKRWGLMTGKGYGQIKLEPWSSVSKGGSICNSDEGQPPVQDRSESQFDDGMLAQLCSYCEEKKKCENLSLDKLDEIPKKELPPSSSIELLLQILRSRNGESGLYEEMKLQAEMIVKESKKERVLKLLEPCQGESYEFMKHYLENAKWKARSRDKEENDELQ